MGILKYSTTNLKLFLRHLSKCTFIQLVLVIKWVVVAVWY